jgi:phospholipase/carboxylesterase
MTDLLETVELATGEDPELSIVWLHGLGADGHDFVPIVPALKLPAAARFVFPHAPRRPVTVNQGMTMRAWYDILAFDRLSAEDARGIRASQAAVGALIDAERARGFAAGQIVLAGFSQGAAIALHAGLRYEHTLAGIMALSGYLPLGATLAAERAAANAATPIFMAHGSYDPVLPEALAVESLRILEQHGYAVDWHSYPMAHMVSAEEIDDISRWLAARFDATAAG